LVGANIGISTWVGIWILKKNCLNFFSKFNGDMVRVGDKDKVFRFNNKDYTFEKKITNCQQP
jgi:hypothetical protein